MSKDLPAPIPPILQQVQDERMGWPDERNGRPTSILNLTAPIPLILNLLKDEMGGGRLRGCGYKVASRRWMPVAPLGRLPRCSSICGVPSNSAQRTSKEWSPAAKGQS